MATKTIVSRSLKSSSENVRNVDGGGGRGTVAPPGNPFAREMRIFAGLIHKIKRNYEGLDAKIRREELQKALNQMFEMIYIEEIKEAVQETHATHAGAPETQETPPESQTREAQETPAGPQTREARGTPIEPQIPAPSTERVEEKARQDLLDTAAFERLNRMLNLFLNGFLKISRPGWRFQNKFLELRLKQAEAKHIIQSMNADELQNYLLNENLVEEEANSRFNLIDKEVNETVRQHHALVKVYRENLAKGIQEILRNIDVAKLEEEISREVLLIGSFAIPYRYLIPFYVRLVLNRRLKQIIYSLLSEDRKRLAEKYFGLYI